MTEFKEFLAKAERYTATSEHCEEEVRAKLTAWEAPGEIADQVIQKLKESHFLDERRYAGAFASDKFRFAGWGRIKIRFALRQKKISDEAISEAMERIPEEDYIEKLQTLLTAKKKGLKGDAYTVRTKLFRFAASRGFETEAINQALKC